MDKRDEHSAHSHQLHNVWDPRLFESLTILGCGNYATVYLVESPQTRQLYAMKSRSKSLVQISMETESVSAEKEVLMMAKEAKHPFVVDVFGGCQTPTHIVLYLEFCQGGDLMHHLQSEETFTMERARFYTAEACLALQWLHDRDILYRNLSLNDILLVVDGHIKLAGFVVSKLGIGPESRTSTFCGSSEFVAPEMLLSKTYNSCIDWWQLGIISYQMLTRESPFLGDNEDDIYDSILDDEPHFAAGFSVHAVDFVKRLLTKEPIHRLGSGTNGADEVMSHAFFAEINWDDLYHKRIIPPFIPVVASRTDTSNFDPMPEVMPSISDSTQPVLSPEEQAIFSGFEFSAE